MSNSQSQFGTEEKLGSRHEDSPDFNRRPQDNTEELVVSDIVPDYTGAKSYREEEAPLLRN